MTQTLFILVVLLAPVGPDGQGGSFEYGPYTEAVCAAQARELNRTMPQPGPPYGASCVPQTYYGLTPFGASTRLHRLA